jgi:cell division protein FtsB
MWNKTTVFKPYIHAKTINFEFYFITMAKAKGRANIVFSSIKQKIKGKRDEIQKLEEEVKALESQLQILEDHPEFLATILDALPESGD